MTMPAQESKLPISTPGCFMENSMLLVCQVNSNFEITSKLGLILIACKST